MIVTVETASSDQQANEAQRTTFIGVSDFQKNNPHTQETPVWTLFWSEAWTNGLDETAINGEIVSVGNETPYDPELLLEHIEQESAKGDVIIVETKSNEQDVQAMLDDNTNLLAKADTDAITIIEANDFVSEYDFGDTAVVQGDTL